MCIAMSMCINDWQFNNGNFDLKSPIAKVKLHQIKRYMIVVEKALHAVRKLVHRLIIQGTIIIIKK